MPFDKNISTDNIFPILENLDCIAIIGDKNDKVVFLNGLGLDYFGDLSGKNIFEITTDFSIKEIELNLKQGLKLFLLKNNKEHIDNLLSIEMRNIVGLTAGGGCHELNNPLAGILQASQILNRAFDFEHEQTTKRLTEYGISSDILEKLKGYIVGRKLDNFMNIISDCGKRSSSLVKDILGFYRFPEVQTNKHKLSEIVNFAILLTKIDTEVRKSEDFAKIKVLYNANNDHEIGSDRQYLIQVLYVLIKLIGKTAFANSEKDNFEAEISIDSSINNDNKSIEIFLTYKGQKIGDLELSYFKTKLENIKAASVEAPYAICNYLVETIFAGKLEFDDNKQSNKIVIKLPTKIKETVS